MIVLAAILTVLLLAYVLLFRRTIFIFAYHAVGHEPSSMPGLVVRPEAFRKQMHFLAMLGFRSVTVDVLLGSVRDGREGVDGRKISITFDDGYSNLTEHAVPVLQRLSWQGTVFVPTAHVGGNNQWDTGFAPLRLMNWEELAILSSRGISVGSHGKSHRSLSTLSDEECWTDVRDSLNEIEARIQECSRIFCYPFGHREPRHAVLLEKAGYAGACSLVAGGFPTRRDWFDMGRLLVRGDSLLLFAGYMFLYPLTSLARRFLRRGPK